MIKRIVESHFFFALKNYQAALIAAFFFGCIAPGAKFLSPFIPPQSLAGFLYLCAGIGLFLILIFRREFKSSIQNFQKKDRKWLLAAILFGGILGPAFLTYGMFQISASTASLLLNLESVLTSLIAWVIFREHFGKKIVGGMVFILAGGLILSLNSQSLNGQDTALGFALISTACLCWGIDNNATRNISHLNPLLTAGTKGLIAGFSNLLIGFIVGERLGFSVHLLQAGVLGFLGIGISLVAFIVSLGKIGTARTGALFSTAPFIGSLLSIFILGESASVPFLIALLLMGVGVWFHLSEDHDHEHTHTELYHRHQHSHDIHHQHLHGPSESVSEPHDHFHQHKKMTHGHPHFPDDHHQHSH